MQIFGNFFRQKQVARNKAVALFFDRINLNSLFFQSFHSFPNGTPRNPQMLCQSFPTHIIRMGAEVMIQFFVSFHAFSIIHLSLGWLVPTKRMYFFQLAIGFWAKKWYNKQVNESR